MEKIITQMINMLINPNISIESILIGDQIVNLYNLIFNQYFNFISKKAIKRNKILEKLNFIYEKYMASMLSLQYGISGSNIKNYFMNLTSHKSKYYSISTGHLITLLNCIKAPYINLDLNKKYYVVTNVQIDYFPLIHKNHYKGLVPDITDKDKIIIKYLYDCISKDRVLNANEVRFCSDDVKMFLNKMLVNYIKFISNAIDGIDLDFVGLRILLQNNKENKHNDLDFCTYLALLPIKICYELDKVLAIYKSNIAMSTLIGFIDFKDGKNNDNLEICSNLNSAIEALDNKLYYKVSNSIWFNLHAKAISNIEQIYSRYIYEESDSKYLLELVKSKFLSRRLLSVSNKSYKNNLIDFMLKAGPSVISKLDYLSLYEVYGFIHFLTLLNDLDKKYNNCNKTKNKLLYNLFDKVKMPFIVAIVNNDYSYTFDNIKVRACIKSINRNTTGDPGLYDSIITCLTPEYKKSHFFKIIGKYINKNIPEELIKLPEDSFHNYNGFQDFKEIHCMCLKNIWYYTLAISVLGSQFKN